GGRGWGWGWWWGWRRGGTVGIELVDARRVVRRLRGRGDVEPDEARVRRIHVVRSDARGIGGGAGHGGEARAIGARLDVERPRVEARALAARTGVPHDELADVERAPE